MKWVKHLLWIMTLFHFDCFAQNRTPSAIWYFPGASYQTSPSVALWGHFGINSRQDIKAIYLQSFIKLNKHITLNPAYLYLAIDNDNSVQKEHTFMHAVHIHVPLGKFRLDDRNMLWNWIRKDAADLYFYRNRLRLSWPFKLASRDGSLYTFDEASYSFNDSRWSRNRLGFGFAYNVITQINIDAFYARQHDAFTNSTHVLLIMATLTF